MRAEPWRFEMAAEQNDANEGKQILRQKAVSLAKDGHWQEALAVNKKIVDEGHAEADDYNRLGKAYLELSEFDKAKESYEKALELDPGNNIARKKLKQLKLRIAAASTKQTVSGNEPSELVPPASGQHNRRPKFVLNSRVRHKGTGATGIVTEILPNEQYRVFIREHEEPIVFENDLELIVTALGFVTPQEFLRDLLIFKMRRPLSDTLYSYSMSRTNFEAYQFKPAIKFLSNPYGKILIADEVGLGKTIEACIIYLELKARMRGDLPRVLVVCPAGLMPKWQSELSTRFREEFEIMDSDHIRRFFDEYQNLGPATRLRGICSIEGLRREELSAQISELGIEFDLVVIDEAHHMRNPETLSFDLGEILSGHTDSLIMLTATPVHLQSYDLFYLLNILEPGEFENKEVFDYQLEPNKLLNKAVTELCKTPADSEGACQYLDMCPSYIKDHPFWKEARELVQTIDSLEVPTQRQKLATAIRNLTELNTFSLVFSRTRRKEVQSGVIRSATVINVPLTSKEHEIYSEALRFARARAQHMRGYVSILGLIQIERQLASSIGAFKEIIRDFIQNKPFEAVIEESSSEIESLDKLPEDEVHAISQKLLSLYEELGETDTKYNIFYRELTRLLTAEPSVKVIVYSFFRKTLEYLYKRLTQANHKVEIIHGGKKVIERQDIIDNFKQDGEAHILLSSEVGAEGLDLQFCNTIINYDLPWNPMRVEQRIGRIDRYGQKSEKVRIISLFLNGTIEERILQRLYQRIGVFEESIGALEPILGDIVRELSSDIISTELTPEQESKKAEEFLLTLEHRKLEMENFERHRYELMGQDTPFINQVEDNISSGRFVSSKELRALVSTYLAKECPRTSLREVDRHLDNWLLVPDQVLIDNLRAFLRNRSNPSGREDWNFATKLQNPRQRLWDRATPGIPVTFDSKLALERPLLEFINVWHPLVRLAFNSLNPATPSDPETRVLKLKLKDKEAGKAGIYYFFLFYLASRAIVDSDELVATVISTDGNIDEELSKSFLKIMHKYLFEESLSSDMEFDLELCRKLKTKALEFMSELRRQKAGATQQRNDTLITIRRAALEKTFDVKIRRAQSRLEKATDSRIIRMYQGEIANLVVKRTMAITELENKRSVSISYEPVACGLLEF